MSSTTSTATTTATAAAATTTTAASGYQGISIITFLSSAGAGLAIFAIQMLIFLLIRNKFARIYIPKTYLVPEKEQTTPPSQNIYGWLVSLFKVPDAEIIGKCGLDAYFFLRYLLMMLKIVVPLAIVVIPILCPLNFLDGKAEWQHQNDKNVTISGLDKLAFGNVAPDKTHRYWAHLILSVATAVWTCFIMLKELRYYIGVRQEYLTSPQHRLRASATTVLISSIPDKWLTFRALDGLYDVFPGGIRNIWINRNFDPLLEKVDKRDQAHQNLEDAETELIKLVKKAQLKKAKKERKKAARSSKAKTVEQSQQEKDRLADEAAARMAAGEGVSAGNPHNTAHSVSQVQNPDEHGTDEPEASPRQGKLKIGKVGQAFEAVGHGLAAGFTTGFAAVGSGVEKGGRTLVGGVVGGAEKLTTGIDGQLEITNGFAVVPDDGSIRNFDPALDELPAQIDEQTDTGRRMASIEGHGGTYPSVASTSSSPEPYTAKNKGAKPYHKHGTYQQKVSQARTSHNESQQRQVSKWKFWETPNDGHPSPLPQGYEEEDEFPLNYNRSSGIPGVTNSPTEARRPETPEKKGFWSQVYSVIPFVNHNDFLDEELYPPAYNEEFDEDKGGDTEPVWKMYIRPKDRPTTRISSWWPDWCPVPPLVGKKVDSIYYWRKELARLNVEIEQDQAHPEKYPLMNSAFIQFNSQAAAHMACQAVSHHLPKQMAPRVVEISPQDVIWDNMSLKWWEAWARTGVIASLVTGMVIFWAVPVSFSSSLIQISRLESISWLKWIDRIPSGVLSVIQGLAPTIIISILLILVPVVLNLLAKIQGSQTGVARSLSVQNYYFAFLFVEVSLVVSISGGIEQTIAAIAKDPGTLATTLSNSLPASANYFFSYMLLQATSTSAGALLQVMALLGWFVFARLFDKTARQKWSRNTTLSTVSWGSFFPVYTNFACLALIYSTIAPLILIFASITFSLFWVAYRYNTLYVARFTTDTGGLMFPRAVNQTFTGLYIMEFCMFGLFLSAQDADGNLASIPQSVIMIVCFFLTIGFQILLNQSFGPLFQYLPITLEDEAVIRDEEFALLQRKKWGYDGADDEEEHRPNPPSTDPLGIGRTAAGIELDDMPSQKRAGPLNRFNLLSRSQRGHEKKHTRGRGHGSSGIARVFKGDLEANKKMHSALYGNLNDEIEDLTLEERDKLVNVAFTNRALRARRPAVWLPRDDTGCSDDEVRRSMRFSKHIWISNHGTGLDSKQRVVYGRNPPDFSEIDLIQL